MIEPKEGFRFEGGKLWQYFRHFRGEAVPGNAFGEKFDEKEITGKRLCKQERGSVYGSQCDIVESICGLAFDGIFHCPGKLSVCIGCLVLLWSHRLCTCLCQSYVVLISQD